MSEILFGTKDFIDAMLWYHYAGIICIFVLFLGFLTLGIVFFKKYIVSGSLFFISFLLIVAGTPVLLNLIESKVRNLEVTDLNITTLVYSPVIVINGNMTNKSMVPVNKEFFKIYITKSSDNWFMNIKNYIDPIELENFEFKQNLEKNETAPFELLIDYGNGHIPKKFNVYILYKAL